jgi:predicted metal-dependent phosphotriesterase family hydrolase
MRMERREFLKRQALLAGSVLVGRGLSLHAKDVPGRVMTVLGPEQAAKLGAALPHEHIMSIFGEDAAERPRYDSAKLLEAVLPQLERVKKLGCRTIFDCTAAYFGRDPAILREVSSRSGIRIVTNTGYYGAASDRYVPASARAESADQIAERWLREFNEGIDGTGIRPGFIKLGVDNGPLSELDRKLIRAAARTHRKSGLTIAVHTGDNPAAVRDQLAVLREEGVSPEAWIWVHAHAVKDEDTLVEAAMQGAWLEFDGLQPDSIERHLQLVSKMKTRRRLEQVLLSHDGNLYRSGKPAKLFEALFTDLLPALKGAGFTDGEIRQMTVDNPARAFALRVRATGAGIT